MRIGGDRKIPVNVRVIGAAGKDLWSAVTNGHFRKDLFFRLNVLRVTIPSLRQRREDIRVLLNHFLHYHTSKLGVKPLVLPDSYVRLLSNYSWPGNVRQLKHFAEQLSLNSMFGFNTNTLDTLYKELATIEDKEAQIDVNENESQDVSSYRLSDPDAEAALIRKALHEAQFSKTRAAEILGISRTTLWRKLKQLQ